MIQAEKSSKGSRLRGRKTVLLFASEKFQEKFVGSV